MNWCSRIFTLGAGWILSPQFPSSDEIKPDTPPVPIFIKKLSQIAQGAFRENALQVRAAFFDFYTDDLPKEDDLRKVRQLVRKINALEGEEETVKLLKSSVLQVQQTTDQLLSLLPSLQAYEHALNDLTGMLNTKSPLQVAEETAEALAFVVRALRHYQKKVTALPKGDFKQGELWRLQRISRIFGHVIGGWDMTLKIVLEKERRFLKALLKNDPSLGVAIQFLAFESYVQDLNTQVKGLLKQQGEIPALSIREICLELQCLQNTISKIQKKLPYLPHQLRESSPIIQIGNPTWQSLYLKRNFASVVTPSWNASENWSDEKKKRVYLLILLVQLACSSFQLIHPMLLNKEQMAKKLQQKVVAAVPQPELVKIDREVAHLSVLLTDKYGAAEVFDKVAERHSEPFRRVLDTATKQYGSRAPTASQVAVLVNEYRTGRLVEISPIGNPWSRIPNNWWRLFTAAPEGVPIPSHSPAIAAVDHGNPYLIELLTSSSFTETAAKLFKEGNELLGHCQHVLGELYTQLRSPPSPDSSLVLFSKRAKEFPRPKEENWKPYTLASWMQSVENFYEEVDSLNGKPLSQRLASKDSKEWINAVLDLSKRVKDTRMNPFYKMAIAVARQKIIQTPSAPEMELKAILDLLTYLKHRDNNDPIFAELHSYLADALFAPLPHHKRFVLDYYYNHDLGNAELAASVVANAHPEIALEWLSHIQSKVEEFVNFLNPTHLVEMRQRNQKLLHDLKKIFEDVRVAQVDRTTNIL